MPVPPASGVTPGVAPAPGAPLTPGVAPATPGTQGAAPPPPGPFTPPPGPFTIPGAPLTTPVPAPLTGGVPVPPVPGPAAQPASPLTPIPETAGPSSPSGGGPIGPYRFGQPLVELGAPVQVAVTGTVEEEFDDNVNQTKTNKQSEFRTNLYPGISAFLDRGTTTGYLLYAPRITMPNNNVSNTFVDQNLTARGRWKPTGQLQFDVGDAYIDSSDFYDLQNPGTRQTGTQPYVTNTGTASAAWLPPTGRLGLSYTNVLAQPSGPNPDSSLTHIIRPDFAIRNPRWELAGDYALTRAIFDISSPYWENTGEARLTRFLTHTASATLSGLVSFHEPDDTTTAVRFDVERLRLGFAWTVTPLTFLDVAAGADRFAPSNTSSKIRPSGSLGFTHRFSYFDVSARFDSGFQEQFQDVVNTGTTFTQAASLLATLTAFRDLRSTLAVRWTRNEFQLTTANVGSGTIDRTWVVEFGIRYAILRPVFLTLNYTLTLRNSTDPGATFTENSVRLGLTYVYSVL